MELIITYIWKGVDVAFHYEARFLGVFNDLVVRASGHVIFQFEAASRTDVGCVRF